MPRHYNSALEQEAKALVNGQTAYIVGEYQRDQFENILTLRGITYWRSELVERGTVVTTYIYKRKENT